MARWPKRLSYITRETTGAYTMRARAIPGFVYCGSSTSHISGMRGTIQSKFQKSYHANNPNSSITKMVEFFPNIEDWDFEFYLCPAGMARALEKKLIEKHDSYTKGLNDTPDGCCPDPAKASAAEKRLRETDPEYRERVRALRAKNAAKARVAGKRQRAARKRQKSLML